MIRILARDTDRQSTKGYLQFIAYLQVIGIVLVVLGHSLHQYPDGAHGTRMILYRLIYSFHMPLFIFVSGFLMVYTGFGRGGEVRSPIEFTRQKILRLIVPYTVLTLVTYFPRAAASGLADEAIPMTARGLVESLYLTERLPIPYFWFLQASFLLLVSLYGLLWLCHRLNIDKAWGLAAMAAFLLVAGEKDWSAPEVFGLRSAVGFGFYFLAGAVYSQYYDRLSRWVPLQSWYALAISATVWIVAFLLWEGTEWACVSAVSGIAMSISLSLVLIRHHVRILDHLVGANYLIFLLSWYFNVLMQQVLAYFVSIPWWMHTLLSLTFGLYIPWLAYRLMARHREKRGAKMAALLLGQKPR